MGRDNEPPRVLEWMKTDTTERPAVEPTPLFAGAAQRPRDADDAANWLYERAEEAAAADLPLERALQAVRDGYSSIEADRLIAEDD